ncbi:hypothetical protein A0256_18815 [Mucilaginibacter sp. PAMC 26640]|nr:hypothetical protein A0256_18815 [Mucilaginibacter sp. PAMC 26640]
MARVFLLSGMGADSRLYKNIVLPVGFDGIAMDWISPAQTDSLATYATKLILYFHIQPGDVVIGNSLGGMIAVEIAKQVKLVKVILISSIKKSRKLRLTLSFLKLYRYIKLYLKRY